MSVSSLRVSVSLMASWSRPIACLASFLRVGWFGAQLLAFVLLDHGYGSPPCATGYSWVDFATFDFLRFVAFPLSLVPSSLYMPPTWLIDFCHHLPPRLADEIEAGVMLASNYYLGSVPLAVLAYLARQARPRLSVRPIEKFR